MARLFADLVHSLGRDIPQSALLAAVAGLLAHIFYFVHGDRNQQVFHIIATHIIAHILICARCVSVLGLIHGILGGTAISASYLAALTASIVVYRIFFHRLRKFPGPWEGRVSKLSAPWWNRDWAKHEVHADFHDVYGDFVRTGESGISNGGE